MDGVEVPMIASGNVCLGGVEANRGRGDEKKSTQVDPGRTPDGGPASRASPPATRRIAAGEATFR